MPIVIVDSSACKGCGLCIAVCPKGNLEAGEALNEAGLRPIRARDAEDCSGCQACTMMCPDVCIILIADDKPEEVVADE